MSSSIGWPPGRSGTSGAGGARCGGAVSLVPPSVASRASVAIVGVDGEGRVTTWASDCEALFGWPPSEALGQRSPMVPQALWPEFAASLAGTQDGSISVIAPAELLRKDGSTLQAYVYLIPSRAHAHGQTPALILVHDVTRPMALVSELAQAEERLRLALQATTDGVWDADLRDQTVLWGDGCYEMLGLSQGEVGSASSAFEALIHPDDRPQVAEALQRCVGSGGHEGFHAEFRARHSEGHWVWVLLRGRVVEWDEEGKPTRLIGTQVDTSAQRQAEQALRESEVWHRLLVEHSGEGVAVMDLDERITYANPAACRIYGVPKEQLIGSSVLSFVPTEEHPTILQETEKRLRGESSTYEHTLVRPDGQRRRILITVTPNVDAGGRVVGTFSVFRDVTDEREAEERRRTVDARLAHIQRLEGLFSMAAGVAHDFSNMLMGVLGNASLALARLPADSPIRTYLRHIHDAATEAGDLAKQLLAYSGGGVVALEPLDLSEVVEGVRHLLESIVTEDISLNTELDPDLPQVHGDPAQLSQLIVNLVTNACEAMAGKEGQITIRTLEVTVDEADWGRSYLQPNSMPERCVAVEVVDTGHGIPPDTIGRIFDPFFTTRVTGRGLGLPAVLGIVRGHEGGIWVTSEPGVGTRVRVALPCIEEQTTAPYEETHQASTTLPKRVLIADDQLNVRLVLSTWLSATEEFDIVTASDGEAAVSTFAADPESFHLVVLDLSMPRMDGAEAMGHIRRMRPDIPIILSSGYGERTARARLRGHEPTAFVQKPYEPQVMVDLIREILSQ